MRTKEKLAQVLHGAGLFEMERNARDGLYDDFESSIATPKIQLISDLDQAAHNTRGDRSMRAYIEDLALRARNGEWDSTKEEAEAWYQREGKNLL